MVYTVRCSAHWVGSNCSWLVPGDRFSAQLQGTTMWVDARKGGNMGKEIRPKFQVLDMRAKPATAIAKAAKSGAILELRKFQAFLFQKLSPTDPFGSPLPDPTRHDQGHQCRT